MKTIVVYDVAAENGGAITILNRFYEEARMDLSNRYVFVVSSELLKPADNIEIVTLSWVKKSWFHRLYCDQHVIREIVSNKTADVLINLQNVAVKCDCYQILYLHNSIPFCDVRFSLFRDTHLWVYKLLIGRLVKMCLPHADEIIVQTNWMKKNVERLKRVQGKRIVVQKVSVPPVKTGREQSQPTRFFYPANYFSYKNHMVLLEACKLLRSNYDGPFELILTLDKNNKSNRKLVKYVEKHNIPVVFVGTLNKEEMSSMYKKSILVFPSYLETVGLPILEAISFGCPLLLSNCEYAHEASEGYQNVSYFEHNDPVELYNLMKECLCK